MSKSMYEGIPKTEDYLKIISSETFAGMEKFSDKFIKDNRQSLVDYNMKWVDDPLHQWSRQWEYPFVYTAIAQECKQKGDLKILDAGSGVTFLPYYLKNKHPSSTISCCDYDASLAGTYEKISRSTQNMVTFACTDLQKLPYDNNQFDIIYCISVLEHTNDYKKIIDEFHRTLKKNGKLLVTFDISIDGKKDICVEKATELLIALGSKFRTDSSLCEILRSEVSSKNVFTTLEAQKINPKLLPWRKASFFKKLGNLITKGVYATIPPLLTVLCLEYVKE